MARDFSGVKCYDYQNWAIIQAIAQNFSKTSFGLSNLCTGDQNE